MNIINNIDVSITIKTGTRYQQMLGFGGAFTSASAYLFNELNEDTQNQVLEMYFSENGNKYNMARLPIGSSDFSIFEFSQDPYPNDYNLSNFKLSYFDTEHVIPFIQKALKYAVNNKIMIVANPWSPPAWMKQNGAMACGNGTCELCQLINSSSIYTAHANYFSKFITEYKKYGIDIYAITPQNEPMACQELFAAAYFTPTTEGELIEKYLGPILNETHPDVKIFIYDHNKHHVVDWVEGIIVDQPNAAKYVEGTAFHWYDGDYFENLNESHYLAPTYKLLATESTVAYDQNFATNPLWSNGEYYAHSMIGDFNNFVIGFIDWNLLLDTHGGPRLSERNDGESYGYNSGCSAMLMLDPYRNKIYPQIFYYYVGHFSRFIKTNDYRIGFSLKNVTSKNIGIEMTAFYNEKENITNVVIMNPTENQCLYELNDDRFNNVALNGTLPPHSIQTIVY